VPDDQGSALIFSPSQLSQDVLCRCLCCGGWVCGSWGQASNQKTTRRLTAAGARFWLLPLLFSLSSVVPLSLTRCGCLCLPRYLPCLSGSPRGPKSAGTGVLWLRKSPTTLQQRAPSRASLFPCPCRWNGGIIDGLFAFTFPVMTALH